MNKKREAVGADMSRFVAIAMTVAGLVCTLSLAADAATSARKGSKSSVKPAGKTGPAPVDTASDGRVKDLDPQGYRYWAPFEKTAINYDYVTGACRKDQIAYYLCCSHFSRPTEETILISFPPGAEHDKNKIRVLFSSKLVNDVQDPVNPKKIASCVQMARTSMYFDEQAGYVCMNSVFPGQVSDYGKWSLVPALFSSPTGEPETWKYHGKLNGDPAVHEKEMKGKHWIGEGSIARVGDGRWRVYLGGYGVTVAAAESASLDGPWKCAKDRSGKLRNVAAAATEKGFGGGGCFSYVLKVSDKEYHLWVTEKWPIGPVWHLSSEDGLDFKLYGKQPEIAVTAAGAKSMKGIRAFLSSDGKTIHGLIPFSSGGGWVIHRSTMPVGLQPASP